MELGNITFKNLLDVEEYNEFKSFFLITDMYYQKKFQTSDEKCEIDLSNDNIIVKRTIEPLLNEFNNTSENQATLEKKVELNFYKDWLMPAIKRMLKTYKEGFISNIRAGNIESDSGIQNYSKRHLKILDEYKTKFNKASHLRQDIIKEVICVIDSLYDYISNDYYQEYYEIPQKIPLNLNKNEVIVLFHLLYENGIISENKNIIKPTDLSRLIEENFEFFNKETNSFEPIKRARELQLRLFGEKSNLSPQEALEHLKSNFLNEDFYNPRY